jgi:hypothetical protein
MGAAGFAFAQAANVSERAAGAGLDVALEFERAWG